jgi:serine/threonine protein kinase
MVNEQGPLDPARATSIAHAISDALAAVHATGMVHGNVHPGTTLIGDDGRVVLADARADSGDDVERDIRAIGGILYFALTGRWPHAEVGSSTIPDATRDAAGALATPRQIRAGVPAYLDDLTMDLLDKRVQAPDSDALAVELGRLDASSDDDYEDVGPLRFAPSTSPEPGRNNNKIIFGIVALAVIAIVGLVFGIRAITSSGTPSSKGTATTQAGGGPADSTTDDATPAPTPAKIPLTAGMVRIVDPPGGDRSNSDQAKNVVDGDPDTAWTTHHFNSAKFGNVKPGMGVLINLGTPRNLSDVRVETSSPGASMEIRTGTNGYTDASSGDQKVYDTFKKLGDGDDKSDGTTRVFSDFDPNTNYQYVLVWVTQLPRADDGDRYQLSMDEVSVYGY